MKVIGEKSGSVWGRRRILVEAIKEIFNYFAIPAVVLLGVEFIITLVCFLRRLRSQEDSRRLLLVGMVLQLLAVIVVLQNALFLPRFLPDLLQRYLGILPFIAAGLYFALIREVSLHSKKSAPAHYILGSVTCLCTLASYLSV